MIGFALGVLATLFVVGLYLVRLAFQLVERR